MSVDTIEALAKDPRTEDSLVTSMAFVGPCPPPLGGVAAANVNAQNLFRSTHEIEVFNTSRHQDREDLYGRKGLTDLLAAVRLLLRFIAFIWFARSPVVHIFATSNVAFLRDVWFITFARLAGKKVIVHLHSKPEGELFLSPKGLKIMAFFLRRAHLVLVLSQRHYEHFKLKLPGVRLSVLENFVFTEPFDPKDASRVAEFLFVGRLTEPKGIFDLIRAVELLKQDGVEARVHLMGAAETDEKEVELRKLIVAKELSENLILHGLLQGEQKYELFHRCALFVFPSHFENSPVVLKEAMAARQIILCSEIEANKNVLDGLESSVQFEVENEKDLAEKMKRFLVDSKYFQSLLSLARCPEAATESFARQKINEQVNRIVMNS